MNLKPGHGKHCIYQIAYHLVLVTKDRRPCITKEMGEFMVKESARILRIWGGYLIEGKSDVDHLHLMICIPPSCELGRKIGSLKNSLSRDVKREFPEEVSQYLYGDKFWSDSYYIGTTGGANISTVRKYIENQGKKKK